MRGLLLPGALLLLCSPASAFKTITRCPEGSKPMRSPDPRWPWVCVLTDERYRDGIECPPGSQAVTLFDPHDPFKCAVSNVKLIPPKGACPPGHQAVPAEEGSEQGYDCEKIQSQGFKSGPQCPRGYKPLPTPGQLRPFRCEADPSQNSEPAADPDFGVEDGRNRARTPQPLKCGPGTEKRATENPFNPFECVPKDKEKALPKVPKNSDYRRYRMPGELSFEYPKGWSLTDAWRDEVPSVFLQLDLKRDGRPVMIPLPRQRAGAPGFVELKTAVFREKEWHGAKDAKGIDVSGLLTSHVSVQGEARTAFVRVPDGYFTLSYGAPADLFERYLPVYERLLKTFRVEFGKK